MKSLIILSVITFSLFTRAYAEIDDACWTSPVKAITATLDGAALSGNKAGATGRIEYGSLSSTFSAFCNRLTYYPYTYMTHYVDIPAELSPSTKNPGWYKLSDDVDVKVSTPVMGSTVYFPAVPSDAILGLIMPPYPCRECLVDGFSVASTGHIDLKLRRDILGGAIVIPPYTKLFTAYRVAYRGGPYRKPSNPIMELFISPGGEIIPIPTVCEINHGNTINVDFGDIAIANVTDNVSRPYRAVDVNLDISCNTSLTQDATIRLVSGVALFSSDLIRSSNNNLGVAMMHKNKVIKPYERFPVRLLNGVGSERITLFPVKNPAIKPSAGAFTASATLIVDSP